jgi:hypothetical protein
MKRVLMLFVSLISFQSMAAPQYTLEEICNKYGNFDQCSSVPFCRESTSASGCNLAQGAPGYMEAMCKLQTEKQGCAIMESQGNCVWIENSGSVCHSKVDRL